MRKSDEASRLPLRLAIGVIIAVGAVALTWLIGVIGFHLGFARTIGVSELVISPGGGLAIGAMVTMLLPLRVFEAGEAQPLWLMLAFLMIAIPAAGLAGVRPATPGGPRPTTLFNFFSWAGGVAAGAAALLFVAWVVSPLRQTWLAPMPDQLDGIDRWLTGLSVVAGLDGLVVTAAALWVVLVMRLHLPAWMKGLSTSAAIVALLICLIAMAMSNAAVAELHSPRSIALISQSSRSPNLLIGYSRQHAVVLHAAENKAAIRMFDVPTEFAIDRRMSIADALLNAMPVDEAF